MVSVISLLPDKRTVHPLFLIIKVQSQGLWFQFAPTSADMEYIKSCVYQVLLKEICDLISRQHCHNQRDVFFKIKANMAPMEVGQLRNSVA